MRVFRSILPALFVLAAFTAPEEAGAAGATISGSVTITGTAGKDDFSFRVNGNNALTITPAVTITGTGSCPAETDPQTGRPVRNSCLAGSITSLTLNLSGGDDNVVIDDDAGQVSSVTANAGPGNDTVTVVIFGGRTFNGDVGDDTLRIPGPQGASVTSFDGGAGRDTAVYGDVATLQNIPIWINGSLQTNQVVLKRQDPGTFQLLTHRTDTLIGIEVLEGTPEGDILAGGSALGTELIGAEGPDNLTAGSADTIIRGGEGLDQLSGGVGADTLDGGTGIDIFRSGGKDTYLMRDGYAETVDCAGSNTVVNDLADAITSAANCTSVQTAAAKHKHDTTILQRRLKIAPTGATLVRIKCPLRKREACAGRLRLMAGRKTLASANYLILQGTSKSLRFRLTRREAKLATFGKVEIRGEEIDDDGRPRAVMRRVPARRKPA